MALSILLHTKRVPIKNHYQHACYGLKEIFSKKIATLNCLTNQNNRGQNESQEIVHNTTMHEPFVTNCPERLFIDTNIVAKLFI